jgi:hypothetical protein
VSEKSAASVSATRPARKSRPSYEPDTLKSVDQIFLHDQLEALLASPTLARVAAQAARSDARTEARADEDEEKISMWERETEPGVDARLLRDALRAGLK